MSKEYKGVQITDPTTLTSEQKTQQAWEVMLSLDGHISPYHKAAKVLGISEGTVKRQKHTFDYLAKVSPDPLEFSKWLHVAGIEKKPDLEWENDIAALIDEVQALQNEAIEELEMLLKEFEVRGFTLVRNKTNAMLDSIRNLEKKREQRRDKEIKRRVSTRESSGSKGRLRSIDYDAVKQWWAEHPYATYADVQRQFAISRSSVKRIVAGMRGKANQDRKEAS